MAKPNRTQPRLPLFESHTVSKAAVKITHAGDGLSDALKIDPVALDLGDDVHYVIATKVVGVQHSEDKDGIVTRVHVLRAEGITPVDPELAGKLLTEARESLERRKAEVSGQTRIEDEPGEGGNVTSIGGKR